MIAVTTTRPPHINKDLSGPSKSYSPAPKIKTVKVWLVIFCCCSMLNRSATGFIQSITRFTSRQELPSKVFCNEGSQLVKGTKDMTWNYTNIKSRNSMEQGVEFKTCPVGGHNVNGKVEQKNKEKNSSLEKFINNQGLSILPKWETILAVIANTISNLLHFFLLLAT